MLAGSVDHVIPLSTKRSSKESRDTEEILNLLKMGNKQTKKTLEQMESTLPASVPDVKNSWCLWIDAGAKEVLPGPVLPDDHTIH